MLQRLRPFGILAGLSLLFFAPLLLHPTQVLYAGHSDLLATFLPVKRFLAHSWQETGELPLWCPHCFAGMPLIHDIQAAAFYPLHGLLYILPEKAIGAALSWLIVGHVFAAGACMYGYSRSRGLAELPALVSAFGYMFAGKWILHLLTAGHYVLIPLAWLPFVLYFLETACDRRSWVRAVWAGLGFALIILGTHPQITFYCGWFVALWTVRKPLGRWLAMGLVTAGIAAAIAAIQILPALEAARESTRAAGIPLRETLLASTQVLWSVVGPGWGVGWEDRACLGVWWMAAAMAAPLLGRGRVRYEGAVALGLLLWGVGGCALLQWLPGFRLFQIPARMLLLLALPVAYLTGQTTAALQASSDPQSATGQRYRRWIVRAAAFGLVFLACAGAREWMIARHNGADGMAPTPFSSPLFLYLCSLGLTFPGMIVLLQSGRAWHRRSWPIVWAVWLGVDLWGLTVTQVAVRPLDAVATPSALVRRLADVQCNEPIQAWRVLDRSVPGDPTGAPLGTSLAMQGDVSLEPVLGYNPLDIRRYKQFLQFISDEDGPITPRQGRFGFPVIPAFPLVNQSLVDLLGVRYVLQPRGGFPEWTGRAEPKAGGSWRLVATEQPGTVFSFLAGGMQTLPPYDLFENTNWLPRAFLVRHAARLADPPEVLAQMRSTDFRQTVLLEDGVDEPMPADLTSPGQAGAVVIRERRPNRISLDIETAEPAYLVLTEIWFPGWHCFVDGVEVPVQRANFVFRAARVPAGQHQVEWVFAPGSYFWGRCISVAGLVLATLATLGAYGRRPNSGGIKVGGAWLGRRPSAALHHPRAASPLADPSAIPGC